MIRRKMSVWRMKWAIRIGLHGYKNELPLEELNPYIRDRISRRWPAGVVPAEVNSLVKVLWNA